jgi:hypothetical protein
VDWAKGIPNALGQQNFQQIRNHDGAQYSGKKDESLRAIESIFDHHRTHQTGPKKYGEWIDGIDEKAFDEKR